MKEVSIIICSRAFNITDRLKSNIEETIGCSYELIIIDNSQNKYSIFEAYNVGLEKSSSGIICFMHDDIFLHSKNWGATLISLFKENPSYGLIGVAGAKIKTRVPSGWWDCKGENMLVNIIQCFPDGRKERQHYGFESEAFHEAVVIDGVFMALRKEVDVRFNSKFQGFHGYDLVLCFEVLAREYKIGVTNEILLEHYSIGNLNSSWLNAVNIIHKNYRCLLPLKTIDGDMRDEEKLNCKRLVEFCYELGNWKLFFKFWLKLIFLKPDLRFHYLLLHKLHYETK